MRGFGAEIDMVFGLQTYPKPKPQNLIFQWLSTVDADAKLGWKPKKGPAKTPVLPCLVGGVYTLNLNLLYVHVYIYTYTHKNTRIHTYIYISIHMYIYISKCASFVVPTAPFGS